MKIIILLVAASTCEGAGVRIPGRLQRSRPIFHEQNSARQIHIRGRTIGTVSGHDGNGFIHVELAKLNRRGYRTINRVWWRKIS